MCRAFSGNKGEWSEPYVILRLLADRKLCQADRNLSPVSDDFAQILEIIRGDTTARAANDGIVVFSYVDQLGRQRNVTTYKDNLLKQANRLLKSICAVKGRDELPSISAELCHFGFKRLTNPASRSQGTIKSDLCLKLSSIKTGCATLGFSVKSELGAPPTLLNASEATNIVYRVKGLTRQQAETANNLSGGRKIMDRC